MLPIICPGHTRPVVDLQFSDLINDTNDYYLISACKDGKPMLRQGSTGDWIGTFDGHKGAVFCVGIDAGATIAATGSADFSVKLWNATQGDLLSTLPHDHVVRAVSLGSLFTEDNYTSTGQQSSPPTHLLSGTNNKNVFLWDLNKTDSSLLKLEGHTGLIRRVCWLGDGVRCLSSAEDKQLRVWDLRSGKSIETLTFNDNITDIEISANEALCTSNKSLFQLNLNKSHLTESLNECGSGITLPCHALTASKYPLSHSDASIQDTFVCGGTDNTVYKCRFPDGQVIEKYDKVHFGAVNHIRFSPDGHLYATASDDGTLRLFQTLVGETYGLWQRVEPTSASVAATPTDLESQNDLPEENSSDLNSSLPTTTTVVATPAQA